jgi:hypothetical protein
MEMDDTYTLSREERVAPLVALCAALSRDPGATLSRFSAASRLLPSTQALLPDACSIETRPQEPFEGQGGRAVQQVRHTT